MFSFEKELDTAETLADCCNAYQNELIRIQKIRGLAAALAERPLLQSKAANMYIRLFPEVMYEYETVEDVMQLIY